MRLENEPNDLALQFVTLNRHLSAGGDQPTALQRLVELAVATITACEWAGVTTWPMNKRPRSLASSTPEAAEADYLQHRLGEGPCLTAAVDSEVVHISDVGSDGRWPRYAAAMMSETTMRSMLNFHLVDVPHPSALNLYSDATEAFDSEAIDTAALFAAHARVLLIHAASADRAAHLEQALTTSRQIGTAVGILMNIYAISGDEAFARLRTTSQNLNRKLNDIADEVTRTGALPTGG